MLPHINKGNNPLRDTMIIKTYALNIGVPNFIKQTLLYIK
jgi:hypothetical protein